MPVTAGPIYPGIKDGLVFAIDPANKDSWAGPTSATVDSLTSYNPVSGSIVNDTSGSYGVNESFTFDGTDDKITGTGALISGNNSRSISLWYKIGTNAAMIPFSLGGPADSDNGSQFAYCINRDGFGTAAIFGKNSAYDTSAFSVPRTDVDGNWHHLVVTYDQTSLKVYLDNSLEATPSLPGNTYNTSAGFTISGWSIAGNRLLNGQVGPVLVYNRALTASEVTQNYNALKGRFGL